MTIPDSELKDPTTDREAMELLLQGHTLVDPAGGEWVLDEDGNMDDVFPRLKLKRTPPWQDELKHRPILCWVSDVESSKIILYQVVGYDPSEKYSYKVLGGFSWKYATPATADEINQLLLNPAP